MNPVLPKVGLFLIFSCLAIAGLSQENIKIAPGGVKGATHWYVVDQGPGGSMLKSLSTNPPSITFKNTTPIGRLNQWPALILNGQDEISINLGQQELSSATYFTVYQSQNPSKEQLIWNIEKNSQTNLVLTTARVADLEQYQYMNFTDVAPATAKINVYGQQKAKDSLPVFGQKWQLGKVPLSPRLPLADFIGIIPELLVFDRVLDRQERLKVASYLALKYGITLTETSATYLDSQGKTLWNGASYPEYHHNIAAIGRDDSSGLLQKLACSSNTPNLLSVGISRKLTNGDFLIWGDNDLTLEPATKIAGMPKLLKRKWLMNVQGGVPFYETEISLDTKQIHAPLIEKPIYWMLVDTSGKGEFKFQDVHFIRMGEMDGQGFAHFKALWSGLQTQKSIFSFAIAQNLLLVADILPPTCDAPQSGQMQLKIVGGHGPYRLSVENKTDGTSRDYSIKTEQLNTKLDGLNAGKYILKVGDSRQQVYIDSLYINPDDAPRPNGLASEYELSPGKLLKLDAADKMQPGTTYHWRGPSGFEFAGPVLQTEQAGLYTLTTSKGTCSHTQEITVQAPRVSIFSSEVVYPNPSSGTFTVKVALNKPAALNLSVYSTEGKLVLTKKAAGADHYAFTDQLMENGLYYIVLRAGTATTTHKLLIIH